MSLRSVLRKSPVARQLYSRTWVLRYLAARFHKNHSFAQAGEDLKLADLLGHVSWFVDIGANDGISGSNSFYFALRGARGICFEPIRDTYTKLRWLHALNPRVRTVRCGISSQNRESVMLAADMISHLPETEDKVHMAAYSRILDKASLEKVTLRRFEDAIAGLRLPDHCDLLSIDVEGHELPVLRSIDFARHSFRAIVIETHLIEYKADRPKWVHPDLREIEAILEQHGYEAVYQSWLNTIYLNADR